MNEATRSFLKNYVPPNQRKINTAAMLDFIYRQGPQKRCSLGDHEFHCGDCFQIFRSDGTALDVRIELGGDWYLIGATPNNMASHWHGCKARLYGRAGE